MPSQLIHECSEKTLFIAHCIIRQFHLSQEQSLCFFSLDLGVFDAGKANPVTSKDTCEGYVCVRKGMRTLLIENDSRNEGKNG